MWRGKRVALVGLGKSNLAVGRYLKEKGASITGFDQKKMSDLGERGTELEQIGFDLVLGPSYLDRLTGFDTIFLTPGIKKSLPQIRRAEEEGATLSSEINVVFAQCKVPITGITGSAGKTTTTSLTGEILRQDQCRPVYVGGNIGTPLIEVVDSIPEGARVVLELSSFQLQLLRVSPQVGAVLNISENHLDVHDSMAEYVESKKNVFRFGKAGSWAVLNDDNPMTRSMAAQAPAHVAMFSRTSRVDAGAFLDRDRIMFAHGGVVEDCGSIEDRIIPGRHNIENILAATACAMLSGAKPEHVAEAVRSFRGVEHRQELVRVKDGIRYYNDSIATAPDRTLAALETVQGSIILIAGGYDKGIGFSSLSSAIAGRVKGLVLIGATSEKIEADVRRALRQPGTHTLTESSIVLASSLDDAVAKAVDMARPGDAVLLSPACASFGMFINFEERGKAFKNLVNQL